MEKTLYIIQHLNNKKYYNAKEEYWTSELFLSSYSTTKAKAYDLIAHSQLKECEVVEVLQSEWIESMRMMHTQTVIKAESLQKQLESIRCCLPTITQVDKHLRNSILNTIKKLKPINPYFKDYLKVQEDAAFDILAEYDEFILELSKVKIEKDSIMTQILRASELNESKMTELAEQILNENIYHGI